MRRLLTRVLFFTVCFALLFTTSVSAVTIPLGGDASDMKLVLAVENNSSPVKITATSVAAQYFIVPEGRKIFSISTRCPSYSNSIGNLTMKLYRWNTNYTTTVSAAPLLSKTFVNFMDNARLVLSALGKDLTGEFLITFSEGTEEVGVWKSSVASDRNQITFVNGQPVSGALETTVSTQFVSTEQDFPNATVKNAYTQIQAEKHDGQFGVQNGSNEIRPTGTGAYAAYGKVDFGSGTPKGIKIRAYNGDCNSDMGEIQVILDDPLNPPVARIAFEYDREDPVWFDYPGQVTEKITGVHTVYLVFRYTGYLVDWFQFTRETQPLSPMEQRLADFSPVPDSSLEDLQADTWSGTDMIGRKLPGYETVGGPREKQVGIFFWTWHVGNGRLGTKPVNVSEILKKNPEAINDLNFSGWGPLFSVHYWNESIYGYYSGFDTWVMRKQMELLTAAGVDGLFFDTTNGTITFTPAYMNVAKTIHEMRQEGIDAPQISFIMPFGNLENNTIDLDRLYENMYKPGLYSDTWYYWKGKPVLMAYPDGLQIETGYTDVDAMHEEMLDFFTFRPGQPSYTSGPSRPDQWPWLEVAPQRGYVKTESGGYECVTVGVAQNHNAERGLTAMNGEHVFGRSYTNEFGESKLSDSSKYYGYNFQEQWENALEIDPEFIFITGWNEWTAGRYDEWNGVINAFPDQCCDEYSRDIEPTKGPFKDNYYYQMVSNIRRFKGVRQTPEASEEKTIAVNGSFDQWNGVGPEYYGFAGGTEPRDFYRIGKQSRYRNTTGRNDIVLAKAARDQDYLYFYVETKEPLTPYTDKNWMRLFLNVDRKTATGWEGYDFVLNRVNPTENKAVLERSADNSWNWIKAGEVDYKTEGNRLMVAIPRDVLELSGKPVDIEFKWNDNMQVQGDIMDFYTNGDTAPAGRYAYRYTESTAGDKTPADENWPLSKPLTDQLKNTAALCIGNSTAVIDGGQRTIDPKTNAKPMLVNSITMVPARFLAEGFGAEVDWNENTGTAVVHYRATRTELIPGNDFCLVNGVKTPMAQPAILKDNVLYLPLREFSERFGIQVYWNDCGLIVAGTDPERAAGNKELKEYLESVFLVSLK